MRMDFCTDRGQNKAQCDKFYSMMQQREKATVGIHQHQASTKPTGTGHDRHFRRITTGRDRYDQRSRAVAMVTSESSVVSWPQRVVGWLAEDGWGRAKIPVRRLHRRGQADSSSSWIDTQKLREKRQIKYNVVVTGMEGTSE